MFRYYRLRDYNILLVAAILVISIIGVQLVGSADSSLKNRQMIGVIVGFIVMIAVSLIDYNWLLNFYWIFYFLNLALLLLVLLIGMTTKGATRWISIGGIQFQPTELSKILLIIFFSMYFMKHQNTISNVSTMLKSLILIGIPLFMIVRQPDLKNTITIGLIFCCIYFAAGLSYKKIGTVLLIVVPLFLILFFLITQTDLPIIDSYQKVRIMTFLNPQSDEYSESAMQQQNSIMAIGSGQLTGKGLNNNEVSSANKGNFVAETQNDFIFAVAGEELGFVGCSFIILLLFIIVCQCIRTGQRARNLSGTLICTGMGSMIAIQSFINICVACGLLPNTGTPLPFVSYGLTSLFSLYIGMGIVLNVSLQRKRRGYPGGEKLHAAYGQKAAY